jgi:hypothetical protein
MRIGRLYLGCNRERHADKSLPGAGRQTIQHLLLSFRFFSIRRFVTLKMTEAPVIHPEISFESFVIRRPPQSSNPANNDIEPVASGSNDIVSSAGPTRRTTRHRAESFRFVESSESSSGDEIGPVDEPGTAPTPFRKAHGKYAYNERYELAQYVIEQLSEYDDADLVKPWHRTLILLHPIVIVWVFMTYAAYYGYRVWCNYQYRLVRGGLNEASWIFICVEGVIARTYPNNKACPCIRTDTLLSPLSGLDGCPATFTW